MSNHGFEMVLDACPSIVEWLLDNKQLAWLELQHTPKQSWH